MIQMVSHGLVAGGLFLMVGMIYERCHTRELAAYGGLAKLLPVVFGVLRGADAGVDRPADDERIHRRVPGAAGRVQGGVAAAYGRATSIRSCCASSAVAGVVLGALYMLCFAQRFLFGAAKAPHQPFADLDLPREARSSAPSSSRSSRSASFPTEPMKQDRARGAAVPAAGQQRRPGAVASRRDAPLAALDARSPRTAASTESAR